MSETSYGFEAYLPKPSEERSGIALCLSGGGYRAALFHLGALRRLDELGVLSQVDTITSVSGGSIMNAKIAAHVIRQPDAWGQRGGQVAGFEDGIAAPLVRLTQKDIRTKAVLERLKPWRWFDQNAQIDVLARELAESGVAGSLADLPKRPSFVFCATDVTFRQQWIFDGGKQRFGDDALGYSSATGSWPLARAAAASSCLPVAFAPMRVAPDGLAGGDYSEDDRTTLAGKIDLSDGGLYDNLGLEPVWREAATVLVCDAAPTFRPDPHIGRLWSQLRFVVTLLEQATDVRKRWLIAGFVRQVLEGTYWGIGSEPTNYPSVPGVTPYSKELIRAVISQVRIDLDDFSEGERAVLQNHGYLMAEIAIKAHASGLARTGAPLQVPYPEWMKEALVRDKLRDSHRTKVFK